MERELAEGRLVAFATVLYAATLAATLATVGLYLFVAGIAREMGVADGGGREVSMVAASLFDLIAILGGFIVWFLAIRYDFSLGTLVTLKSTVFAIGLLALPAWFMTLAFPPAAPFTLLLGALVAALNLAAALVAQAELPPGVLKGGAAATGLFLLATVGGGVFALRASLEGENPLSAMLANLLLMLGALAAALYAVVAWRGLYKSLDEQVQRARVRETQPEHQWL